jgi:hypothetical protein
MMQLFFLLPFYFGAAAFFEEIIFFAFPLFLFEGTNRSMRGLLRGNKSTAGRNTLVFLRLTRRSSADLHETKAFSFLTDHLSLGSPANYSTSSQLYELPLHVKVK